MSYNYSVRMNNHYAYYPNFRSDAMPAPLAKPIQVVQKTVEGAVDTVTPQDQKKKHKKVRTTAIAAGSAALVLAGIVTLLNPKSSSKIINKLKTLQQKTKGDGPLAKFIQGTTQVLEFSNNINSAKDKGFKWLCTGNKVVGKAFVKPYNAITNFFDKIGKHTVHQKYSNVSKKMDAFEEYLSKYKDRLNPAQKQEFEKKLAEIKEARKAFSKENITSRLEQQEKAMSNLEEDFVKKFKDYKNGFKNNSHKKEHIKNNMTFWAQDIVQPTRDKLENEGNSRIARLMGGKSTKGAYDELLDIIAPTLTRDEKVFAENALNKTAKKLNKANLSECVEYFDKKRDLILGSAPTDIVTAVASLLLSGVALSTADNKDDRISKLLTGVFPIIAGLGASMFFTAKLYSGVKGMLYGFGTSAGLSIAGSVADHCIKGNNSNKEIMYA